MNCKPNKHKHTEQCKLPKRPITKVNSPRRSQIFCPNRQFLEARFPGDRSSECQVHSNVLDFQSPKHYAHLLPHEIQQPSECQVNSNVLDFQSPKHSHAHLLPHENLQPSECQVHVTKPLSCALDSTGKSVPTLLTDSFTWQDCSAGGSKLVTLELTLVILPSEKDRHVAPHKIRCQMQWISQWKSQLSALLAAPSITTERDISKNGRQENEDAFAKQTNCDKVISPTARNSKNQNGPKVKSHQKCFTLPTRIHYAHKYWWLCNHCMQETKCTFAQNPHCQPQTRTAIKSHPPCRDKQNFHKHLPNPTERGFASKQNAHGGTWYHAPTMHRGFKITKPPDRRETKPPNAQNSDAPPATTRHDPQPTWENPTTNKQTNGNSTNNTNVTNQTKSQFTQTQNCNNHDWQTIGFLQTHETMQTVQKFWRVFRMWKFVGMHNLWWCQENDISPFDHHNQTCNCPQSPTNHTLAVKLGHCHNVITGSMNQILDLQISLKLPHGDHQKMLPARDKVYKTIRSTTTLHHVPLRPLKTAIQNLTFPLLSGDVVRSNSMLDASKPHLPENRSKNEDAISGLEKVFMLRDWTCPKREKWKKWHGTEQWKQEKLLNTKKSTVSAIWSSSSGLIVQCCPLLCNAKVPTASQCQ